MSDSHYNDLIGIARSSIESVLYKTELCVPNQLKDKYSESRGVFVTLNIDNKLRGCIGFVKPVSPLWDLIVRAAKTAAFEDPRFSPLTDEEYRKIAIDISVLTKPELINAESPDQYPTQIEIGRDGLSIEKDHAKGILLPQVFTEFKVDAIGALEMLCKKAGLDKDAWKDKDTKIYKFSAEVVSEKA